MDRNDRETRDAAGVGPYAREREHLIPLSSLGAWKVSDGEPDIRGWEVRTVAGRQLGGRLSGHLARRPRPASRLALPVC